jgi:hypothetical protein
MKLATWKSERTNKNKEKETKGQEQPKLTVRKDPRHLQDVPTKENSNKQSKRTEKVQKKKKMSQELTKLTIYKGSRRPAEAFILKASLYLK